MPIVAILDANVLFSARIRDLMVRLALAGLFQARWTDRILDECFDAILESRPDLTRDALARTRELLSRAVPDVLVEGYESQEAGLELPDPKDRHVLAATMKAGASVIVTANTRDFPEAALAKVGVAAIHPDDFLLRLLGADAEAVQDVLVDQAAALRKPATTVEQLLDGLAGAGLPRSVAAIRALPGADHH